MGLFSRKEKTVDSGIPMLPRLPRLPDLPDMEDFPEGNIHQLPSLPSNSIGARFSRDTIKDAVSGEKRGGKDFYADDFSDDEMRMMHEPLRRPLAEEMEDNVGESREEFHDIPRRVSGLGLREEAEPVFVRIDRFEEGLRLFEAVKDQISAIERSLAETRRIKEREEIELQAWENELKKMREEMEKIGRNVFSKI